jgi:hypothetical protein
VRSPTHLPPTRLPLIAVAGLIVAIGIAAAGCTRRATTAATDPAAGPMTSSDPAKLSEAEIRYGASPKPDSRVTYQPNVIVMEHGAEAIRSQSADGFTWSIDANAPGAADIQPDKILFATGRVVGRVLKVERKGGNFDVTLGPAELTDIFEEAHISSHGALDPATMIVYVAPATYPGTFMDRDAPEPDAGQVAAAADADSAVRVFTVSRSGELLPFDPASKAPHSRPCEDDVRQPFHAVLTSYIASDRQGHAADREGRSDDGCMRFEGGSSAREFRVSSAGARSTAADIESVLINGFNFTPNLRRGLEVVANYDRNGMKFNAHANISLNQPKFTFRLDISHGLKTAVVELEGVGGIDVGIEGGTSGPFKNVNQVFAVPIDISFPIAGPVPFAATFHQSLLVQTMFSAKQAVIRANGAYSIGGKISAGIVNGSATGTAPLFINTTQNMAYSLSGESLGVNGIVLAYGGKLIVGLGAFGLVVGPYASINTSVGITRGSDLQTGLVAYTCRSAKLELFLDYGLGFAIPAWSAKAVNVFLGLFHAKPISSTYGTSLGTLPIKTLYDASPPSCAEKPAS